MLMQTKNDTQQKRQETCCFSRTMITVKVKARKLMINRYYNNLHIAANEVGKGVGLPNDARKVWSLLSMNRQ